MGGPIPLSSIRAFPVPAGEADIFARCIRDADAAYLAFLNKPEEERKPMKQLAPGMIKGKT